MKMSGNLIYLIKMNHSLYKLFGKTFWLLLFLPLQIIAQDITGVWSGFLLVNDIKVPYELTVSGNKNHLTGYSMITFTFNGVENVGVKTMEIKLKRGSIGLEDGDLIYDNYSTPSRRVKLYGNLAWVGRDSNMTLAGTITTRSMDMRALNENNFKGMIKLQRKRSLAGSTLVTKLSEMGLLNTLSFIQPVVKTEIAVTPIKENEVANKTAAETVKRETEVIRTVVFKTDSLVLSLYDNGEIDGDTVTLILNGQIIMSKQGLTDKAIRKTIATTDIGDSSKLVLYAENLGRIPPNSGLLILQDGNERYQVRFSGDLQKNSAIILRRRK
jgi:hypothetical protein